MQKNGISNDENMPVIAEDEDYLMEEFDDSRQGQDENDKNAEEELVEQLEDFETMRENQSDNDNDNDNDDDLDEALDEVEDMAEKENAHHKHKRILKHPSQRHIYTSEGADRGKEFGIIGKAFNDEKKGDQLISKNKMKDQMSPRGEKRDDKKSKNNKANEKRVIKDMQIDPNVMIVGNQMRPGEVIGNEKKKDKNQKSIIGWFNKLKV